jgi:hypothetical protein
MGFSLAFSTTGSDFIGNLGLIFTLIINIECIIFIYLIQIRLYFFEKYWK